MESYDVIVIGGGCAGCSCAYNSAKLGLKTLLIEKGVHLGGAITSGLVIPVMQSGKNQINTDFFEKLIFELKKMGGQISYQNNRGWFNPELTKIALDKILTEVGVKILFNTFPTGAKTICGHVQSIDINKILSEYNGQIYDDNIYTCEEEILSGYIGAKYFVDATGNCDFSKLINCEFLNDSDEFQPMSLRFIMSGVDTKALGEWLLGLDDNRDVTNVEVINGVTHLSTACTWDSDKHWALAPLFKEAVAKNTLKEADSNYFQIFTIAGTTDSIAFNCPRIIKNLNPLNIEHTSEALIEARSAIYRIANFCKKYFRGFKNAYISNIADSLGVRVSRRIRGKYVYKIEDIKSGKTFENPALISNYPIDVHSGVKNNSILEQTAEYQLPIESLMSNDYDNLFVAGRCLSAEYEAQGALRVQSSCFSMGEAVAKHIKKIISKV